MKLTTLTVLFAFLIILIIILTDRDQLVFVRALNEIPLGDKAGHFILYGILSFLLNLTSLRSLPRLNPRGFAFAVTLLLSLAIGLEEWAQRFFPARTADWVDLLFSYLGVASGAWLAYRNRLPR